MSLAIMARMELRSWKIIRVSIARGGGGGDDDRVFILSGSMARLTPQWDEQVLGPANTMDPEGLQ